MAQLNKRNRETKRLEEALAAQIQSIEVSRETFHAGPLPDPDTLVKYENALPGLGDRIVRMAEVQSEHRRKLESALLTARIDDADASRRIEARGQQYALIVALVLIVGGIMAIFFDHAITGSLLTGTTLISLVGLFIYGRSHKQPVVEEPKEKANATAITKTVEKKP